MSHAETDLQAEPPDDSLVENEGVDAGELTDDAGDESTAAARSGGRPQDAGEQVQRSAAQDQMTDPDDPEEDSELLGAPDPGAEAGGQDSGSIQ